MNAEMKLFFLTPTLAIVIPAQAGIQCPKPSPLDPRLRGVVLSYFDYSDSKPSPLDPRLRGDDGAGAGVAPRFRALRVARGAMEK